MVGVSMWSVAINISSEITDERGATWRRSQGVPTFFLDSAVQGIAPGDAQHARKVAATVVTEVLTALNLSRDMVELHIVVTEI